MKTKPRNISGILFVDKSQGMSSNAVVQRVKKLYQAKKVGHTGTLDPLATGILQICLGEGTKFASFFLSADKSYRVRVKLGIKTTTGDAEGEIIESSPVPSLKSSHLEALFSQFTGEISQVPPMYSALKHHGKPLYKLAREGIEVERKSRTVTIHRLQLVSFDEGDSFQFDVHCTKGTYVRTLVEDMGSGLGCGAYVTGLRRLGIGNFSGSGISLEQLEEIQKKEDLAGLDKQLLSIDAMFQHWPEVKLSEAAAFYIRHGQPAIVPFSPEAGWVRLVMKDGSFVGVGEVLDNLMVAPRRLVSR